MSDEEVRAAIEPIEIDAQTPLYYRLDVPVARSGSQGGTDRYSCCHHTVDQGHAETCSEERRVEVIEAALARAGFTAKRVGYVCLTRDSDGEVIADGAIEQIGDEIEMTQVTISQDGPVRIVTEDVPTDTVSVGSPAAQVDETMAELAAVADRDPTKPQRPCETGEDGAWLCEWLNRNSQIDPYDDEEDVAAALVPFAGLIKTATTNMLVTSMGARLADSNEDLNTFLRPIVGRDLDDATLDGIRERAGVKKPEPFQPVEAPELRDIAERAAGYDAAREEVTRAHMIFGVLGIEVDRAKDGRIEVRQSGVVVGHYEIEPQAEQGVVWRPRTDPPGKTMPFLNKLRSLNVERCEAHWHPIDAFNLLEWAGSMAGEAGEAANLAKKILCRDRGMVPAEHATKATALDFGEEVADTIIYADLALASVGLDLAAVVRRKFNSKSREMGYERTL